MDSKMFFLYFFLLGMLCQENAPLATNAWNDGILAWLEQNQLHINVDNSLEIQPNYSRCSGDPQGFVGNKNNNHDVLCFDVDGVDGKTYRLYEKKAYVPNDSSIFKFGCDGNNLSLTCPDNEIIQILLATYEGTDNGACPGGGSMPSTHCNQEDATDVISRYCQGLSECQVHISNTIFQTDPCSGSSKVLRVLYSCIDLPGTGRKDFTVLASFKSMFSGSEDVIINEIQFCLTYINASIAVDFLKLSVDYKGMMEELSWGLPGMSYTRSGLTIKNTSGYMFIVILTFSSGEKYSFEIMRPGMVVEDYYFSIKAYGNDLSGLMGQVHAYNIYSSNHSNMGNYGVGEINNNGKYFVVQKRPRGNIQCWYYMNQGNMVNAIYGDIAQYLQPTC